MTSTLRTFRTFTASLLSGTKWHSPLCQRCGYASNSSSQRWLTRQSRDPYTKEAKLRQYKSRAAFKLLFINDEYKIFRPGQTVVDLGFAPGSWSQVAIDRVSPGGRVIGLDIIPAVPPTGVSTFQGNFLSPSVQKMLRDYLSDPDRGRPQEIKADKAYIDMEREETEKEEQHVDAGRRVDVVLSDMCEPWPQSGGGLFKRSLTNPWHRMMNTSGTSFRDHAGSMDLCNAALLFALDVLKAGGHFVCKFYQGGEDKELEKRLKKVFKSVHRVKPDSSRKESKECYFVALRMDSSATREAIADMPHQQRINI
ncbi:23S ribosomal RNA methyltransferase [Wilcoxina mikolae CBS 423.85]|nr:23S ribosomal RNA methyltransferase [Wilcoxina mikolae CBS 423.85]